MKSRPQRPLALFFPSFWLPIAVPFNMIVFVFIRTRWNVSRSPPAFLESWGVKMPD